MTKPNCPTRSRGGRTGNTQTRSHLSRCASAVCSGIRRTRAHATNVDRLVGVRTIARPTRVAQAVQKLASWIQLTWKRNVWNGRKGKHNLSKQLEGKQPSNVLITSSISTSKIMYCPGSPVTPASFGTHNLRPVLIAVELLSHMMHAFISCSSEVHSHTCGGPVEQNPQ